MTLAAPQILAEIASAIEGAPAFFVMLDGQGRIGLGRTNASGGAPQMQKGALPFQEIVDTACKVIAGAPRATTEPGIERRLATAVVAAHVKLSEMAQAFAEVAAANRSLRAALGPPAEDAAEYGERTDG